MTITHLSANRNLLKRAEFAFTLMYSLPKEFCRSNSIFKDTIIKKLYKVESDFNVNNKSAILCQHFNSQ